MPSSNKTLWLELNKWAGSDKPKKDDFNADNQKLDDACRTMGQTVSQHGTQLQQMQNTVQVLEQSAASLDTRMNTTSYTLTAHTQSGTDHVTAAEREQWNRAGEILTGTYTGTGSARQKITLGYQPKFGVVFAIGEAPSHADFTMQIYSVLFGFLAKQGCSGGVTMESDGFSVTHNAVGGADGFRYRLNESGVTYVYVMWK